MGQGLSDFFRWSTFNANVSTPVSSAVVSVCFKYVHHVALIRV